eukprot:CAMPEP_0203670644 /NCGR_PEP_ID=MMETSP0090-20130426/6662_1 /ASSEMBLY_ACC=CAM_ASM_001088 /TAXON_ID=426623 /ORGANISM="Chaetoceros affinis, Strain CCMP159" /LENGTH=548 /DNA_ID=CAMNT_0050535551 /DNA_START=83 /DNA_END=1729 /DNA_ORIENTATION=+
MRGSTSKLISEISLKATRRRVLSSSSSSSLRRSRNQTLTLAASFSTASSSTTTSTSIFSSSTSLSSMNDEKTYAQHQHVNLCSSCQEKMDIDHDANENDITNNSSNSNGNINSNKALNTTTNNQSHNHNHNHNHTCHDDYRDKNIPLPPPLPEPTYSVHRRILPQPLIQLSSPHGKILFKESLLSSNAEAFFPLSEQFLNQSDPAYCGITSLIMVLNAFGIDPNVRWKGGWRWYGSEDMVLETCCIDPERVKRAGILMEEYRSLGRCQGLQVDLKRPYPFDFNSENGNDNDNDNASKEFYSVDEFREDIKSIVQNPPIFESKGVAVDNPHNQEETESYTKNNMKNNTNGNMNINNGGGGFMVVSFARPSLGQTGEGHFSPVAAYHEASDKCLILDVARFKYGPYWVGVKDLYEATRPVDDMTNQSRGWFLNYYPPKLVHLRKRDWGNGDGDGDSDNGDKQESQALQSQSHSSSSNSNSKNSRYYYYRGAKATDELKRPAEVVPIVGSGAKSVACPVGKIKIQYCSVGTSADAGADVDVDTGGGTKNCK